MIRARLRFSLSLFLSYPFSHAYIFHLNCTRTPLSPSLSLSFCLDFLFLNPRPIRNLRTFFHPCLPSTRVHTHTHTHRDTHGKHTNFSPSHAFRVCICMYVYVFMYVSLFCCLFLVCYSYYINRSRSIMKKCSVPLPYDYSNSAKANNLLSTTIDANNFEIKKKKKKPCIKWYFFRI